MYNISSLLFFKKSTAWHRDVQVHVIIFFTTADLTSFFLFFFFNNFIHVHPYHYLDIISFTSDDLSLQLVFGK
jgi:hypothetical protein